MVFSLSPEPFISSELSFSSFREASLLRTDNSSTTFSYLTSGSDGAAAGGALSEGTGAFSTIAVGDSFSSLRSLTFVTTGSSLLIFVTFGAVDLRRSIYSST